MVKAVFRLFSIVLIFLCLCSKSPFDPSTDLGKNIVDDVDNTITDFDGDFEIVLDNLPTVQSSFHTKHSEKYGFHNGANRLTAGVWSNTGEQSVVYVEFAYTNSNFDSLKDFQQVNNISLYLTVDPDFAGTSLNLLNADNVIIGQTHVTKGRDDFLGILDTIDANVIMVTGPDGDNLVKIDFGTSVIESFNDSLLKMKDYLDSLANFDNVTNEYSALYSNLNSAYTLYSDSLEIVKNQIAGTDPTLDSVIQNRKNEIDELNDSLQLLFDTSGIAQDSLDSLHAFLTRRDEDLYREIRYHVELPDSVDSLIAEADSLKKVIDSLRISPVDNKAVADSLDSLQLIPLNAFVDSLLLYTIVLPEEYANSVDKYLSNDSLNSLVVTQRDSVDTFISQAETALENLNLAFDTLLDTINMEHERLSHIVDSLAEYRDSIGFKLDSIDQEIAERIIKNVGFAFTIDNALVGFRGYSVTGAPYLTISYTSAVAASETFYSNYGDYSVTEENGAALDARPVASWASGRKARFQVDFSRLWAKMESVDSDVILKAHLSLSVENGHWLSAGKDPTFAYYFTGYDSLPEYIGDYYQGLAVPTAGSVFEIPVEDTLMAMYADNKNQFGYLHIGLLSNDEYWAQINWLETDVRLETVLFENPR